MDSSKGRTLMRCWQYLRWMSSVLSNCWVKTIFRTEGGGGGGGRSGGGGGGLLGRPFQLVVISLGSDSSLSRKSKHSRTLSIVRLDMDVCDVVWSLWTWNSIKLDEIWLEIDSNLSWKLEKNWTKIGWNLVRNWFKFGWISDKNWLKFG